MSSRTETVPEMRKGVCCIHSVLCIGHPQWVLGRPGNQAHTQLNKDKGHRQPHISSTQALLPSEPATNAGKQNSWFSGCCGCWNCGQGLLQGKQSTQLGPVCPWARYHRRCFTEEGPVPALSAQAGQALAFSLPLASTSPSPLARPHAKA